MDTLSKKLEIEARQLFISVSRLVLAWNSSVSSYSQFLRIKSISDRLLLRLRRRQDKLFNCESYSFITVSQSQEKYPELYKKNPGGFAPPSAQSPDVLGQAQRLHEKFIYLFIPYLDLDYSNSEYQLRLRRVIARSNLRIQRRKNLQPGGFALSSRQPSGVVGEGIPS